jgi:hypothetical protein
MCIGRSPWDGRRDLRALHLRRVSLCSESTNFSICRRRLRADAFARMADVARFAEWDPGALGGKQAHPKPRFAHAATRNTYIQLR